MFLLHWIFALLKLVIKFLLITCFTNVVIAHVCCYFQTRDYTDYADYIPPSPTTANIAESLQYVKEQKAIADFSFLAKDELKSRLQARALPNERLVKAFGIENSFTTFDKVIHSKFLKRSRNVMQGMNSEQQWVSFFAAARIALQRTLFDLNRPIDSQPLASITRSFVFVAILHRFFGVDPVVVNIDDALQATDSINHLWMESKTSQPNLHEHQERLEAALKRLLPKHFPCEPECHPLNTIIPAYETMWRVVLLTYISAGFRTIDLEAIIQFRQIVASAPICFRDDWGSNSEEQAVILNFAKEGLRLYPPTRHIHRAIPDLNPDRTTTHTLKAADIETCHRDPRIWGPDALLYCPSRFRAYRHPEELIAPFTASMRRAYMPFGTGKHRCPAAEQFGERAVIVLVTVLAKGLGTRASGARVQFGDGNNNGNGKGSAAWERDLRCPLPTGRMDMEDWTLERGVFIYP